MESQKKAGSVMKKENLYKWVYFVGGLLSAGFIGRLIGDYIQYDPMADSAPFWVFILLRTVIYLIPAAAAFIVGAVLHKKQKGE